MEIKTIRFKDLLEGKDHFYLIHMNHRHRSREEEMWDFARNNNVIGLDHREVSGDWSLIKERVKGNLTNPWPLQFDMLCENMHRKSMVSGDIVIAMAGWDSVLGIGRVNGKHEYKPELNGVFFDHIRPVDWIVSYAYDDAYKISSILGFNNTFTYVTESKKPYRDFRWLIFHKMDFPIKGHNYWVIKKRGEPEILRSLIEGTISWSVTKYNLQSGGFRKPPNIGAMKSKDNFLIYYSEGKKRIFCALGTLVSKELIKNEYKLTFANSFGKTGFNSFPINIDYDNIKDEITWKPIEGNIQAIKKEDFLTILDSVGLNINSNTAPEFNRKKSASKGTVLSVDTIAYNSKKAMEYATKYEESQNRQVIDVSGKITGYDLESIGESKEDIRYIEVKSRKGYIPLALTSNEFDTAKKLGDKYFLYVITSENLYIIRNPSKACTCEPVNVIHYQTGKWMTVAQKVKLPHNDEA